jgi:hypothetical protein
MLAGDIEVKFVLGICGFLGNFYGRSIFVIYCGVNILIFNVDAKSGALTGASTVCGWICIGFGIVLLLLKFCSKSDSLLTKELDTYIDKHKAPAPEDKVEQAPTTA